LNSATQESGENKSTQEKLDRLSNFLRYLGWHFSEEITFW